MASRGSPSSLPPAPCTHTSSNRHPVSVGCLIVATALPITRAICMVRMLAFSVDRGGKLSTQYSVLPTPPSSQRPSNVYSLSLSSQHPHAAHGGRAPLPGERQRCGHSLARGRGDAEAEVALSAAAQ